MAIQSDFATAIVAIAAGLSAIGGAIGVMRGQARYTKDVTRERDRLLGQIYSPGSASPTGETPPPGGVGSDGPVPPGRAGGEPGAWSTTASAQRDKRFALLLIDYYAHGLTQAKRSFMVSLTCSTIGGLVLLVGIGLAIWRAETTGDLYASMTASVAGVVTNIIAVLFQRQARQALNHMEVQTHRLRDDMKTERNTWQAITLLESVTDPLLKARLQAALILQLSGATLPSLDRGGHPPPTG
ncbi:hypothetical protein [Streptomyces sp. NPDC051219]|uniref:TRADD-N-associated membrane domain-containing protein n=1 Tax=Streptomyces sp. NPDC051219 TaxID=3155283 RepID=UPI003445B022